MGILLDALDKIIDQTCSFKLKEKKLSYTISDDEVYKILDFKGTGEIKKFDDIYNEYIDKKERLIFNIRNDIYPREEHFMLHEHIVMHNYQVIFEKDDITLRHLERTA